MVLYIVYNTVIVGHLKKRMWTEEAKMTQHSKRDSSKQDGEIIGPKKTEDAGSRDSGVRPVPSQSSSKRPRGFIAETRKLRKTKLG